MLIKNIGIMAHVDAGKTTVTEQILYQTGTILSPGRVDQGNTVTDSLSVERQRGITVKAGSASVIVHGTKINILDTPGHMDFYSEVQRVYSVLEGAILVISAKEGIQSQTRNIFRKLKELRIPTIIFLNKIDRCEDGNNLEKLYSSIQNNLSSDILVMQNIKEEKVINKDICSEDILDSLIERDEMLQNLYFEDRTIGQTDASNALKRCIAACSLYPIYHGSALKGYGIQELIESLAFLPYFPGNEADDFSGYVFKVERDSELNRHSYIKVLSGEMKQRQKIILANETPFKIKEIQIIDGITKSRCEKVSTGEIAVLPYAKEFKIGDIIGVNQDLLVPYTPENSVLQVAVECVKKDKKVLFEALTHLTEEDPDLNMKISEQGEISISVMGNTQLEIIENILSERYHLKVSFGEIETVFKERPVREASHIISFGVSPNPYPATIGLKIEPLTIGSGIVYESEISYGYLNLSFQNAVKDGVMKFLKGGLYGWEVVDCRITFFKAYYASPVSTPSDFRNLTPYVLEGALKQSETEILEPVYSYTLEVPESCTGKAIYDIQSMRGTAEEIGNKGLITEIKGKIPVDTSKEYSVDVASYTKGEGIFQLYFFGYKRYSGDKICSKFIKDRSGDKIRNMFIKAENKE